MLSSAAAAIAAAAVEPPPAPSSSKATGGVFASPQDVPDSLVRRLDAVLVLGGGRPARPDDPPPYVKRRCDDAVCVVRRRKELVQQQQQISRLNRSSPSRRLPVLCLSAGTAHVPQLINPATGLPVWESTASAAYLLKRHKDLFEDDEGQQEVGVDGSNRRAALPGLFVETTSYDTLGNAFYARTSHADWNGWRTLLVVTSEFHMERSKAIFDWIFSAPPFPESTHPISEPPQPQLQGSSVATAGRHSPYELHYLSSPDTGLGLDEEALEARRTRERASLQSVRNLAAQHSTMGQVWEFLHARHDMYSASRLVARDQEQQQHQDPSGRSNYGVPESDAIAKSYGAVPGDRPSEGSLR